MSLRDAAKKLIDKGAEESYPTIDDSDPQDDEWDVGDAQLEEDEKESGGSCGREPAGRGRKHKVKHPEERGPGLGKNEASAKMARYDREGARRILDGIKNHVGQLGNKLAVLEKWVSLEMPTNIQSLGHKAVGEIEKAWNLLRNTLSTEEGLFLQAPGSWPGEEVNPMSARQAADVLNGREAGDESLFYTGVPTKANGIPIEEYKLKEAAAVLADQENETSLAKAASTLKTSSDERFWKLVEQLGWGMDADSKKIKAGLLQSLTPEEAGDVEETASRLVSELMKRITKWEDIEGEELPVSDDGFNDLTSHIVGLGKEEYSRVMADPSLALQRANDHKYQENFRYVIPYKTDFKENTAEHYKGLAAKYLDEEFDETDMGSNVSALDLPEVDYYLMVLDSIAEGDFDVLRNGGAEKFGRAFNALLEAGAFSSNWGPDNLVKDLADYVLNEGGEPEQYTY